MDSFAWPESPQREGQVRGIWGAAQVNQMAWVVMVLLFFSIPSSPSTMKSTLNSPQIMCV